MIEKQDLRLFTCVLLKYSNFFKVKWPPWSWSCGSWIYNYLCNQCLSQLTWFRIPFRRHVLDTTLCDKVCQWLVTAWWFSSGTLVSSSNKTDRHDINEIFEKVRKGRRYRSWTSIWVLHIYFKTSDYNLLTMNTISLDEATSQTNFFICPLSVVLFDLE